MRQRHLIREVWNWIVIRIHLLNNVPRLSRRAVAVFLHATLAHVPFAPPPLILFLTQRLAPRFASLVTQSILELFPPLIAPLVPVALGPLVRPLDTVVGSLPSIVLAPCSVPDLVTLSAPFVTNLLRLSTAPVLLFPALFPLSTSRSPCPLVRRPKHHWLFALPLDDNLLSPGLSPHVPLLVHAVFLRAQLLHPRPVAHLPPALCPHDRALLVLTRDLRPAMPVAVWSELLSRCRGRRRRRFIRLVFTRLPQLSRQRRCCPIGKHITLETQRQVLRKHLVHRHHRFLWRLHTCREF